MASKIIPFRPRETTERPTSIKPHLTAQDRSEALPDWLREHKVDWIFKEADRRQTRR